MWIKVVGLGPGAGDDLTQRAKNALDNADILVGYNVYIDLIKDDYPQKEMFVSGMGQEVERCQKAIEFAKNGKNVAVVCSGDSGVYGMASLVYELCGENSDIKIEVVSGITAALGGAAVLGAPLTHDFSVISLSDLMTPWEKIEKRLELSAQADFVICIYNPRSRGRADYLDRACNILLKFLSPETVCGYVKYIGRDGEKRHICTLAELVGCDDVDMFTTVFIGNSTTKEIGDFMVTPRGYSGVRGE